MVSKILLQMQAPKFLSRAEESGPVVMVQWVVCLQSPPDSSDRDPTLRVAAAGRSFPPPPVHVLSELRPLCHVSLLIWSTPRCLCPYTHTALLFTLLLSLACIVPNRSVNIYLVN